MGTGCWRYKVDGNGCNGGGGGGGEGDGVLDEDREVVEMIVMVIQLLHVEW